MTTTRSKAADQGYYRHPTIHGEAITFVCEDDLWMVPASGGVARRLTANPAAVSFPSYSPDGASIAFTGRDEGHSEVYVMDGEGGPARRLTWLGAMTQVIGWTPDGKEILFASDWRQPFRNYVHLYAIPAGGGPVRPLRHGPCRAISHEPGGGGVVIGRNSGDPARWKRYRGGTAGTLWIDRAGQGDFARLLKLAGNLANPMWIGGRIYFLADHEGAGNIYSCTSTGRDLRRHTDHEDYYVRFPSTDGTRIVYHAGADIYLFDPRAGNSWKVPIEIRSPRTQRSRRFTSASRYLEGHDLHPQGHSIACGARGGLYTMGLWEGAATRIDNGNGNGGRVRLGRWLPDGERMVAVSDEGGEESLVILRVGGKRERRVIRGDFGRAVSLVVAPSGPERAALANQRHELILIDLKSGKAGRVARSEWGRIEGMAFSPDGRWLAYGFPVARRRSAIHLLDLTSGRIVPATKPDFYDTRPSFDPDGKYLYFLSWRVFDPVADSHYFDLGFPRGSLPFLITLRKDLVSPFSTAVRALRAPGAPPAAPGGQGQAAGKAKPQEKPAPPRVEIDLEGITERAVAFPVPEARYGRIRGARGRAVFSSFPIEGLLGQNWVDMGAPPAKGRIEAYDFEQGKVELVQDRITHFRLSMDAKVLAIRAGARIRVVPAAHKADNRPESEPASRESGWLDLERIRVSVVPTLEWRQMFREAWRLQRDQFWTPDMSGIDWKAIFDRYFPLADRVATRAEFSDLLWEMQGELGTSHCYELGGDYRPEPTWHQGFLGADLELDPRTGTWRIARIPRGDSWDEKRSSPLAAPGLNLREGDEILEVAGFPVGREASPYERLVNLAQQDVQLAVRSKVPAKKPRTPAKGPLIRTVTVRTLRDEYLLRYRDWVERNRERVHAMTQGRVGYIHVPDMGAFGYSEFHRYYAGEVDREGLMIDVRWNGGGNVSQLLLEKLLRRRIGYDANRWGRPDSYPSDAPMGPMVALTNEYAGSDGDIFSHCFKLYGLGPLIGKRTWGGVVGIWPRHSLVDGTITTQPEFAFWFRDVGWRVENYGTDPDIEVEIRPQDHAAGLDPQLERGVTEVLKLIRKMRPAIPELTNRPVLRFEGLPKERKRA